MRIALSGTAGSGKGTLGSALASSLQLPFIPSGIKETGELLFHMQSYTDLVDKGDENLFQYSILANQIGQERAAMICSGGFVAERTVIDYLAYYEQRGLLQENGRYALAILEWAAKNYDLIIYTSANFEPADKDSNIWRQREPAKRSEIDTLVYKYLCGFDNVIKVHGTPTERLNTAFDYVMSYRKP